jgi:DNA repair protein RecN (Recombination protein N)
MDCAARLTEVRAASARQLASAIEKELHDLNFKDAKLELRLSPAPSITELGADQCEIYLSTNRGEPMKPLTRVASGGEISRIMLAIKNITAEHDAMPTMIFDEIDTGISGMTASVVGSKLREISREHQIICITHLPQIAACGDDNYKIDKSTTDTETFTQVLHLTHDETVDEIARLMAGESVTDTARQNARELIAASK